MRPDGRKHRHSTGIQGPESVPTRSASEGPYESCTRTARSGATGRCDRGPIADGVDGDGVDGENRAWTENMNEPVINRDPRWRVGLI
jgi:hypothetical protein